MEEGTFVLPRSSAIQIRGATAVFLPSGSPQLQLFIGFGGPDLGGGCWEALGPLLMFQLLGLLALMYANTGIAMDQEMTMA